MIDADAAMERMAPVISTAPAAGIEIVRRRDCKRFWGNRGNCVVEPDWFCADGRKK